MSVNRDTMHKARWDKRSFGVGTEQKIVNYIFRSRRHLSMSSDVELNKGFSWTLKQIRRRIRISVGFSTQRHRKKVSSGGGSSVVQDVQETTEVAREWILLSSKVFWKNQTEDDFRKESCQSVVCQKPFRSRQGRWSKSTFEFLQ